MQMPGAHPRWGVEFDWFGVDKSGAVAVFSASGYGAVPEPVLTRVSDVDAAADQVLDLPKTGAWTGPVQPKGVDHSWFHERAARGLFVYDWADYYGPYQLMSSPTAPITVGMLPDSLRSASKLVSFELRFVDTLQVELAYLETAQRPC